MYGFGGVGLSEVQLSISELSVVGGWWWWWVEDKRTSWSDLHRVRQKTPCIYGGFRGGGVEKLKKSETFATIFLLHNVNL